MLEHFEDGQARFEEVVGHRRTRDLIIETSQLFDVRRGKFKQVAMSLLRSWQGGAYSCLRARDLSPIPITT
jgi:hypothetical protein